jgi:hypothetical protein
MHITPQAAGNKPIRDSRLVVQISKNDYLKNNTDNLLPPCGGGIRWGVNESYPPPPSPSPIKGEGVPVVFIVWG